MSFTPIKVFDRFFDIFKICFTVVPYFMDIFWWEGYADVNLAINDIFLWHLSKMEASALYSEITFWLVQNIRPLHEIELFLTKVGLSIIFVS